MTKTTFGALNSFNWEKVYKKPPVIQKEAVLLLLENGLKKDEIMKKTNLFRDEYNALFDGSLPLYKLGDDE
ncbi:hypothetical protein [Bartonella apis]|uniref:hypothetical protein n=1 Tax=Bartonella apis TaxID=1686310 RepID=UPI00242AABEC|nr:hypothetical protein [Bartonella apis]